MEYKKIHQNKSTVTIPRHYLVALAELSLLSHSTYRVLLFILCRIDGERYTMLDFKKIAETLNMDYNVVMGAIYELEDYGIIKEGTDIHTASGWIFCLDQEL